MTRSEFAKRIIPGPFTIHVADGRSFEVPHEDYILLPPRSTVAVVALPDEEQEDGSIVYATHDLPLLMISGVTHRNSEDNVKSQGS